MPIDNKPTPEILLFQRGLAAIKTEAYADTKILNLMEGSLDVLAAFEPDLSVTSIEAAKDLPRFRVWTLKQLAVHILNMLIPGGCSRTSIWFLIWQMRVSYPSYRVDATHKYHSDHVLQVPSDGDIQVTTLFLHGIGALIAGKSYRDLIDMPWDKIRSYKPAQIRCFGDYNVPFHHNTRTKNEMIEHIDTLIKMGYAEDYIWHRIFTMRIDQPDMFDSATDIHG